MKRQLTTNPKIDPILSDSESILFGLGKEGQTWGLVGDTHFLQSSRLDPKIRPQGLGSSWLTHFLQVSRLDPKFEGLGSS